MPTDTLWRSFCDGWSAIGWAVVRFPIPTVRITRWLSFR
jgi:hypothetical protein